MGRAVWVDMKLLLLVTGLDEVVEIFEDVSGDVAFQAADDLSFALALSGSSGDVGAGAGVGGHADEHDAPERFVGESVAARVEPFACDEPG